MQSVTSHGRRVAAALACACGLLASAALAYLLVTAWQADEPGELRPPDFEVDAGEI